jgi:hypothetical protein
VEQDHDGAGDRHFIVSGNETQFSDGGRIASDDTVQEFLGHTRRTMTKKYARVTEALRVFRRKVIVVSEIFDLLKVDSN